MQKAYGSLVYTFRSNMGLLCVAVILLSFVYVYSQEIESVHQCYDENGVATRCEPRTESFSFQRVPIVNSTCGSSPSNFCTRQIDPVFRTVVSDCSGVCNASDPANSHPPEYMTDFLLMEDSWWQSENSLDTRHVVAIDLALQTLVELRVITFDFVSFKPNSFYILRSEDFGATYTPYHYFSTECTESFGISPNLILDFSNETTILCQTIDTPPVPGSISFFPLVGRPSTNDSIPGYSSMLLDFIIATNIRVILLDHYPIADLAPDDFGYYYAIKDLNIVGGCQCNGHAASCSRSLLNGQYLCDCEHNTTGQFCQRCANFYQDRPWRRANGHGEFECVACNCNNHTTECVFDPDVYQASGEISGGVCVNCEHNTEGRQCERCASLHYQAPGSAINQPDACQACNCALAGVMDNGECAQTANQTSVVGQCSCKPLAMGRMCDQCVPGYFNLSSENSLGCQECGCNNTGALSTLCDAVSGVCECKPNINGDKCDSCLPGHYQPNATSDEGCLPCDCNLGGSYSPQCDLVTGQCQCRVGVQGRTCSETIPGFFYPSVDYLTLEAEDVSDNPVIEPTGENERFTGTGFARILNTNDSLNLGSVTIPASGQYEIVLRYTLLGVTEWDRASLTITPGPGPSSGQGITEVTTLTYSSWFMGVGVAKSIPVYLQGGRSYHFSLHSFFSSVSPSSVTLYIDSLCPVPASIPSLAVFSDAQIVSDYTSCLDQYRRVSTQGSADPSCAQTIFTVSVAVYNGTLECSCDATGSVPGTDCEPFGGQCVCLPGVRGRQCSVCTPFSFNLTSSGCSRCDCNALGSLSDECDPVTGQCVCRENVIGRDCSLCDDGFRGTNDLQCVSCLCDSIGSMSAQCDDETGVCECKPGVTGDTCDRCADLHYGFQITGCRSCDCAQAGSTGPSCNVTTGQCLCVENVVGRDCSVCTQGTFNLDENNPSGCQTCYCSGLSTQCSSANGYVRSSVAINFNSTTDDVLGGWQLMPANINDSAIIRRANNGIIIESNSDVSLQASQQFLGNKLSSYGQFLQVRLLPVMDGNTVTPLSFFHVILDGHSVSIGGNFTLTGDGLYTIQLYEVAGWVRLDTLAPVSTFELQRVLSSLRTLSVFVYFNTAVTLSLISLDTAIPLSDSSGELVRWVEQCVCPLGYAGLSCEQCARRYTRTPSGTCELCQCNGFSSDCDPETGACTNCTQFTSGLSCDSCQSGTYGDPTQGISCEPCPCPLTQAEGGRFSSECVLLPNGEALCTNCSAGHVGQNCEFCSTGYFGDPTGNLTGQPFTCTDCLCNGNIDQSDSLSCNPMTGVCTRCLGNTTGNFCERCADGFYGDAITAKNCTACDCDVPGSESGVCDSFSGQCPCLVNIVGLACDRCAFGYYGLGSQPGSGCLPCNCDLTGSVSAQCGEDGQCVCLPGVTGARCGQCLPGYFNFSSNGCQECSCSAVNSPSTVCEDNGTCICLPGSTGPDCRRCVQNYYDSSQGCTECPSCYQEIENEANNTEARFTIASERLTGLINMLTESSLAPFDPRLVEKQRLVNSIVMIINALSMREANITVRYNALLSAVMGALTTQNSQIEYSLDELKRRVTTVIVLSSTSNELVDRIIFEFFAANSFLDTVRNELFPSIVTSTQRIQASLNVSLPESISLNETLSLVSGQVADIQANLMMITEMLSDGRNDISAIRNFFSNTSALVMDLQGSRNTELARVGDIERMRNELAINIQRLENRIIQLPSFPSPPTESDIQRLISLSDTLSADVNTDISSEISMQQQRLNTINQTLRTEMERLEMLQVQLERFNASANSQNMRSQNLLAEGVTIVNSANQQLLLAEAILQNLEQFSNNSLQIAAEANRALQSVTSINEQTILVLEQAQNLTQRVAVYDETVNMTKKLLSEASPLISQAEEDVSSFDSSSLLAQERANVNGAISARDSVSNSSSENQAIQMSLEEELNDMSDAQMQLNEIELSPSQSLLGDAMSAVNSLQELLRRLTPSDGDSVAAIEAFLVNVTAELSTANIEELTAILRQTVVQQTSRRLALEASVNRIQEQILYIDRLQASLPTDCPS